MATRYEQKMLFRRHHYTWNRFKGTWILLGPDGWRTTEQEAERLIQQQRQQPPPSPHEWARAMIEQRALILDTETTGLDPATDEIIELASIELDGTVIINTLVQSRKHVPADATRVHGITNEMLAGKLTFPELWDQLAPYLSRPLVIYNAAYDIPLLAYNALSYGLRMARPQAHCLMTHYTDASVGPGGSYQKLENACRYYGIPVGNHRALADAQAARQVLTSLAEEVPARATIR